MTPRIPLSREVWCAVRNKSILKGLAAGLAGGLAATLVMDQFQKAWSKGEHAVREATHTEQPPPSGEQEDATEKAAGKVVRIATGRELSKNQRKKGGPMVHYLFGSLMGGVYGVAAEYYGGVHLGYGVGFGTALFFGSDEVGVPAAGLSPPSTETPLPKHAQEWMAHLVYGATADTVRRLVRRML